MSNKGFLILAQNNKDVDYIKQAYALALSIKFSQATYNNVSLVTNDVVPEEYASVFDNILSIPWEDNAKDSDWKIENRWKLYHVTPYEETIVLDSDMLLLEDITLWWNHLENYDLKFCSKIKNYKSEIVKQDTVHRKAFISNNLPNVYFALHYFKKSDFAHEFYKTLEFVVNNWELCYGKFAPNEYQNWLSIDLASAIAIEILDISYNVTDLNCPLEFIHMKPAIQGWALTPSKWQDTVHSLFTTSGELLIANIKQFKLFHYVEKDFITPVILSKLRNLADARR
jgi:hypothetical protein